MQRVTKRFCVDNVVKTENETLIFTFKTVLLLSQSTQIFPADVCRHFEVFCNRLWNYGTHIGQKLKLFVRRNCNVSCNKILMTFFCR